MGVPVKSIDYVEIDEKAVRSYNAMFANDLPYGVQSVCGEWRMLYEHKSKYLRIVSRGA